MGIRERIKDIEFEVTGGAGGRRGQAVPPWAGRPSAAEAASQPSCCDPGRARGNCKPTSTWFADPSYHCLCCLLQMGRTQKNKATEYHLGG